MLTNQIFVFGSNTQGRHGKGAALYAKQNYGAINGVPEGRQGMAYGIITKELRKNYPAITIEDIAGGVVRFVEYANNHPDDSFYVTPIGCGLAGFNPKDIAPLFADAPNNVELSKEFLEELGLYFEQPNESS